MKRGYKPRYVQLTLALGGVRIARPPYICIYGIYIILVLLADGADVEQCVRRDVEKRTVMNA